MTDNTSPNKPWSKWHAIACAVLVVLVLYPLSIGPAIWVLNHVPDHMYHSAIAMLDVLYALLVNLCALTSTRELLDAYIALFFR